MAKNVLGLKYGTKTINFPFQGIYNSFSNKIFKYIKFSILLLPNLCFHCVSPLNICVIECACESVFVHVKT